MQRILIEYYFLKSVIDSLCEISKFSSVQKCVSHKERYKTMDTMDNSKQRFKKL